jgi:hypothetical protein
MMATAHSLRRAGILCALFFPAPAFAQHAHSADHHHPPAHAQLHTEFYQKLQRPDVPADATPWRKSCCNDRDCAPARSRFREGRWQFLFKGTWREVPASKIVKERSPDSQAHACVSIASDELLCFVKPDFGI